MKNVQIIQITAVALIVIGIFIYAIKSKEPEHYRDPIWMQPKKLYNDYYPRANGSIYGTPLGGWDMMTGYPFYPRAY